MGGGTVTFMHSVGPTSTAAVRVLSGGFASVPVATVLLVPTMAFKAWMR